MRLKSYTAPSMAEAMHLVRQELGEDAIIVSTQRAVGGKGVRITAALEPEDAEAEIGGALAGHDVS
ncbi:MAG: GTP-binding protein, partial [Alphaproteobacteria bacterium]|nr:GTP-binding protein [Alphaproteobacteria bacterium]MBF0373709.1 GTP-binding protein [Alphaproteobacteria bacterium]